MQHQSIMLKNSTIRKSVLFIVFGVGLAFFLTLFPQGAFAYSTTAQSVTKLSDTATLFQITYRLNFLNREVRVPIIPRRVTMLSTSSPQLQFSLRDENGEFITTGTTTALVLSSATIADGQYYLPEATPGLFTLVALVEHAPTLATTGTARLQVDWLPFTLIGDGKEQLARIPDADLVPFVTPATAW